MSCRCLKIVPWIAIACTLLLAVTIPVWFTYSSTAADSTQQVLRSANAQVPDLSSMLDQASSSALLTLHTVRIVALVLLAAGLGLVCLVAGLHTHHKYRQLQDGVDAGGACRLRSFVSFSAAGSSLLWLGMLLVVLLLALCTSWLLVAWGADAVLGRISQVSSTAEGAVRRAADSASGLVLTLKQAQLDVMDSAPKDVRATQWFKDFRQSVDDLESTVLAGSGSTNNTCKPGCVSLDLLAGLAGLQDNCICLTNTLTDLQQGLGITRQALVPVLVGLLLSYLAVSWLLLYAATSYVVAKRHLQDTRLSASGICPYKHCSSVDPRFSDAAIDIHSSGSTDPKLVAAAAAGLGPRNSLGGVSAAGSTRIPASYPGTGGVRLQENFSQNSDVELFTPHSRTQLFGLGRPGSSSAASSSNAARSDADTSVDIAQYYRA